MMMASLFRRRHHHSHSPLQLLLLLSRSRRFNCSSPLTSRPSPSPPPSSSDEDGQCSRRSLSQDDELLISINLLIPRLCYINQLPTAIRLTSAALLLLQPHPHPHPPPLHSLPIPIRILIHSLSSQDDISLSASLLTRLRHHSPPVASLLIASYLHKRRPRDALHLFEDWFMRPSSCPPHPSSLGLLLGTFCRHGMVFEALKVLSSMLVANIIPGSKLRTSIFRCLLREARIKEAQELDEALSKLIAAASSSDKNSTCAGRGGTKEVELLLDRIFRDWTE